jgi:ABC-type spermidine/putrescine transport system permease subunit I
MVIRNEGLVNSALVGLGIVERPIQILYTDFAILLGLAYVFLPLMVLPLCAAMERLDRRLLEAAYDLYASRWRVLRHVVLPLVRPGLVAGSILVFIPAIGAYVTPRVPGGGRNMVLANLIELQFGQGRSWPLDAALALALTLLALVSTRWRSMSEQRRQPKSAAVGRASFRVARMPGFGAIVVATFAILYLPIVTLVVFSFNETSSVSRWGGFSLRWYEAAFGNA